MDPDQPGHLTPIIDFDALTRDPANPKRLRSEFDAGDHVHPNDAGNQAMADVINLSDFSQIGARFWQPNA